MKRISGDTFTLINREKQLEDNYSIALQKRDEYEQKLKEYEETKLAANFGADFAMPVNPDVGNQPSPVNDGPDRGSPIDECPIRLVEATVPDMERAIVEEDQPEVRDDGFEKIEEKVFFGSSNRHDDQEPDMFTTATTAPEQQDALDSIFQATQEIHPPAPEDDDFFNDKKPAHVHPDDVDDLFAAGDHLPPAQGSNNHKLEDLVGKDSDDDSHSKEKEHKKDEEDFFN